MLFTASLSYASRFPKWFAEVERFPTPTWPIGLAIPHFYNKAIPRALATGGCRWIIGDNIFSLRGEIYCLLEESICQCFATARWTRVNAPLARLGKNRFSEGSDVMRDLCGLLNASMAAEKHTFSITVCVLLLWVSLLRITCRFSQNERRRWECGKHGQCRSECFI